MTANAAKNPDSRIRRCWRWLHRKLRCGDRNRFFSASSVTLAKSGPDSKFDPGEFFDGDLTDTEGWRFLCLWEAGWSYDRAQELAARTDVDLHKACALIEKCPEPLALEILAPL